MVFANHLRSRITPAYAGQILLDEHSVLNIQDHPRIRGTNGYLSIGPFFLMGSSPHTRDKSGNPMNKCKYFGIIPAYAGQISSNASCAIASRDHPRIRGTNESIPTAIDIAPGSSPHTRDKYSFRHRYASRLRIIPAYAGQIREGGSF